MGPLLVLMLSGISDYLDGKLRRRWNQISKPWPGYSIPRPTASTFCPPRGSFTWRVDSPALV